MAGSKRNRPTEENDPQSTKDKDSVPNSRKVLDNANLEDTETNISTDLNGVDSNDESDDSDSSVYSELENDDESSEDENEEEMNTSEDEDTDQDEDTTKEEHQVANKETNGSVKVKKSKTKSSASKVIDSDKDSTKEEQPTDEKPVDEYEFDSSDEEDIRNTIGNVPIQWYDEYDHLGYSLEGTKLRKPKAGDQLDKFLNKMDDPNFGVTVRDPMTGQDVVLSEKDIDTIRRLRGAKVPNGDYSFLADDDPLRDAEFSWFSSQVMQTPIRGIPEAKRSFLPSVDEKRAVGKMVHAIKMGWMKPTSKVKEDPDDPDKKSFYMLWKTDDQVEGTIFKSISVNL